MGLSATVRTMFKRLAVLTVLALGAPAPGTLTLGNLSLGNLALAASSPALNHGLSEPQRRAVWTHAMRGQLAIAQQTQDMGLTRLLAAETRGQPRTAHSASLSCAVMDRLDAQAARQQPLVDALHRRLRGAYGLSAAALDAFLREGETKGWPLP